MTLTQLNYIVAVSQYRSFLKAAEACHVTQPSLSQQVQKLEEELGVQIFDRQRQPVQPTPLGEQIIAQALVTLKESQKISHLIDETRGDLQGEITLGVIPTLAPYLLPLFLKKFSDQNPKLKIIIEELQTEQVTEKIHSRQIDLGLVVTPLEDVTLVQKPLFLEPFLVYVSEGHPLAKQRTVEAKDLSQNDIYLLKEGHCFREQSLYLCQNRKSGTERLVQFESGSLETLKEFVESGEGYTLLPSLATQKIKHSKLLKPFVAPVPSREVSLVYSQHFSRERLLEALMESILLSLPKDLKIAPQRLKRLNIPL
ncbi:hydrogen peroxide-inducible genes activator [Bdellovibrio sp. HCB337]|uniref:hydrogen peroxide-inducible genes activator n=1 Tax=Bdellovibrio sp. HCB337 TaxID=3394358 RepID=UPI0039A62BB6